MKKRTALKTIAALLILCLLPAGFSRSACAATAAVTIPKKLKTVPRGMFEGDASVTELVIQEGTEAVEAGAFAGTQIKKITLPASLPVDAVGENAFGDCEFQTVITPRGSQWDLLYQPTAYRALVIGERHFYFADWDEHEDVKRNHADADRMRDLLKNMVIGPGDPPYSTGSGASFQVTRKIDLKKSEIRSAIINTFKDTRDQDLSVFFIATHGDSGGDGNLYMPDGSELSFKTLASWLNTYVKGRVFVILESCGSGSSIYSSEDTSVASNDTRKAAPSGQEDDSAEFLSKAIEAFAEADHGIRIPNPSGKKGGVSGNSTGDLKIENKFYVLAASEHHKDSYGWESTSSDIYESKNFFTMWLREGIGSKEYSPADKKDIEDGYLSLIELYLYIDEASKTETLNDKPFPYQQVMCFPENCREKLLKLK